MSKRQILHDIRARSGLSFDAFAKKIGFATGSGYQRYEKEDPKGGGYSLSFIQRIAKNVINEGSPPINLADVAGLFPNPPPVDTIAQQIIVYDLLGIKPPQGLVSEQIFPRNSAQAIRVRGTAQALFWAPIASSREETSGMIPIPFVSTHPAENQYALRVSGKSFNKRASDGHYAICFEFDGDIDSLRNDAAVHVERERNGERETTLRVVKWSSRGLSLHYCSFDTSFDEVVHWPPEEFLTEKIRIVGVVIGYFAYA